MKIQLEFKLEDFWVGVFWKSERNNIPCSCSDCGDECYDHYCDAYTEYWMHVWICFVPCLPIHLKWKQS